jgi:hypothetical protein
MSIDDKIDEWHRSMSPLALHEYLGWTWSQFQRFVEKGIEPK